MDFVEDTCDACGCILTPTNCADFYVIPAMLKVLCNNCSEDELSDAAPEYKP